MAASRGLLELPDATDQPAAAARLVLSWARIGQSDRAQRLIDGRRASLSKSRIDVERTATASTPGWTSCFVKTAQFRLMFRQSPPRSPEGTRSLRCRE